MKKRWWCCGVAFLLVWALAADYDPDSNQLVQSTSLDSRQGIGRLGSGPPKCEHKCGNCEPCIAIKVPTTQTANYQPQAWECYCQTDHNNP